jgi:hypothetical protein
MATTDRKALRDHLAERLFDAEEFRLWNRIHKCGEKLWIVCTCCGRAHEVETRCDLKWCPSCQPLLARRTVTRYEPVLSHVQWPLFVTFTTRNYADAKSAREVRQAFTRLRRHRWWKRCVRGGVAQVEVSNRGKGWHPHIHALVDCRWLSVTVPEPKARIAPDRWKAVARAACSEVAAAWSDCLGGRKASVKVRRVWSRDGGDIVPAMKEVLKYSVSPDTLDRSIEEIAECIHALDRMRNLVSWGTLYRRPELKREKHPLACECGAIGAFMPEKFA